MAPEKLQSEMDYLKHLVDKVDDMFDKLFISDNGAPALREQVHQNTKHRCDEESAKEARRRIYLKTGVTGLVALAIAIYSYFHLA